MIWVQLSKSDKLFWGHTKLQKSTTSVFKPVTAFCMCRDTFTKVTKHWVCFQITSFTSQISHRIRLKGAHDNRAFEICELIRWLEPAALALDCWPDLNVLAIITVLLKGLSKTNLFLKMGTHFCRVGAKLSLPFMKTNWKYFLVGQNM